MGCASVLISDIIARFVWLHTNLYLYRDRVVEIADPTVVKWLTRSPSDLTIAGSSRGRAVCRR